MLFIFIEIIKTNFFETLIERKINCNKIFKLDYTHTCAFLFNYNNRPLFKE